MSLYYLNNLTPNRRSIAANLEVALQATGTWTEVTTGFKPNLSDWPADNLLTTNQIYKPLLGPGGGSALNYRIFKMNDSMSTTSPWYIKVTWRNSRQYSNETSLGISLQSGTGYNSTTYDITGADQYCEMQQGSTVTTFTNPYATIIAYDSGFVIVNLDNESGSTPYIVGAERTKNISGTLTNQLAFYYMSNRYSTLATMIFIDTINNNPNYWVVANSQPASGVSSIRDFSSGVTYGSRMFLTLTDTSTSATGIYHTGAPVSMNRPGSLSSLTCGPYLTCSNGVYGPPRLILFASSLDIQPGVTQSIIQDGVARNFYAPMNQRIISSEYIFYDSNYTLLLPLE